MLEHPAVTSAIIGPRTMEQLDDVLAGADVRLDAATLDAIDDVVPPGTDICGRRPVAAARPRRRPPPEDALVPRRREKALASVEELSDQLAIRDLLAGFADAVNQMDPEMLREVFTEDGEWVVTGYGEPRGHDAIVALLADLLVKWEGIFHAIHTGTVELAGDTATGRWYFTEFGKLLDGTELRFAGVYHDDYVRGADGRWRFARRRYDGMFNRFGTTLTMNPFPPDLRGTSAR